MDASRRPPCGGVAAALFGSEPNAGTRRAAKGRAGVRGNPTGRCIATRRVRRERRPAWRRVRPNERGNAVFTGRSGAMNSARASHRLGWGGGGVAAASGGSVTTADDRARGRSRRVPVDAVAGRGATPQRSRLWRHSR